MRRILLLNQNHIGDALFTTPAIAALRAAFPDAVIVNAAPRAVSPIFDANPHLTHRWERGPVKPGVETAFLRRIRRARFDTVIVFSATSTLLGFHAWLSGAETRIGYDNSAIRRFLTTAVPMNRLQHHAEDHLNLVRALAPVTAEYPMEMRLEPDWVVEAEAALSPLTGEGRLVGLNPGATVARKQWAVERWAALGDELAASGCQPVLFGGPSDAALLDRIRSLAGRSIPAIPRLGLGPLAAAIQSCSVFVSGDTGPLHMAVAVGTPVVALHGPTDPSRTGPFTTRAVTVHHTWPAAVVKENDAFGSMDDITVPETLAAVAQAMALKRPDPQTA